MNDSNIAKGIMKKNAAALDELIKSYGNLVHYIVYSILDVNRYGESIEECINDIYFAVWNNMDCYDPNRSSLKSWLAAVSKYKSIDYKRKLQYRYRRELYELDKMHIPYHEEGFESDIDFDFYRLLDGLNDTERLTIIKRYLDGHGIDEISEDTGVSSQVVYKRLSRGREKIRKSMIKKKEDVRE